MSDRKSKRARSQSAYSNISEFESEFENFDEALKDQRKNPNNPNRRQ